jgi:uroporphyrinogen decarboxylase
MNTGTCAIPSTPQHLKALAEPLLKAGISPFTNRERFLAACECQSVDRPPVWLMRQAGRCLPEYRALKERFSFVQIVQTPELAAEVTLQPVNRFGFDAAILFSDILVIPEALGQSYRFHEKGGVEMESQLQSAEDIEKLEVEAVQQRLHYATVALSLIRKALGEQTALLGFAGSPWTLANYMLEGGSAKEFTKAKRLFYSNPKLFNRLMEKLTTAVISFLQMQVNAGVDAIQIFDSSGGNLANNAFEAASASWIKCITTALHGQVPLIVFSRGVNDNWETLVRVGANILSVDWTVNLRQARDQLPNKVGIQGNLDPFLLTTTPDIVSRETERILKEMRGTNGFIFNLGHGVPPTAKLENIAALVETVRSFR